MRPQVQPQESGPRRRRLPLAAGDEAGRSRRGRLHARECFRFMVLEHKVLHDATRRSKYYIDGAAWTPNGSVVDVEHRHLHA